MTRRILITGSRDWDDAQVIREALLKAAGTERALVVSGNCPKGADFIAENLAVFELGFEVELHPAEWDKHPGKSAAFVRNAEMVRAGADTCLAFSRNGSRGTQMTYELARKAGMDVELYEAWGKPSGHPAVIDRFRDRWSFLSNFYEASFEWDGLEYLTAEHAFNAAKTLDPAQRDWVRAAPTAKEAKARGRKVDLREGWDDGIRYDIMRAVIQAKFTSLPRRTQALLRTGSSVLVEGNMHHDQHWGDCRCGRASCSAYGANHLGKALMELRTSLAG